MNTQKLFWMVDKGQLQQVGKLAALEALYDNACECVLVMEWRPNSDAIPALKRLELKEETL